MTVETQLEPVVTDEVKTNGSLNEITQNSSLTSNGSYGKAEHNSKSKKPTKALVKRDPITGEGANSREITDFGRESETPRTSRRTLNKELIIWDPVANGTEKQKPRTERDPIALLGDLGIELDPLNPKVRPGTGKPKNPIRNPIVGNGDFGKREWDPIWKYAGKPRRSSSYNNEDKSNPLTGENAKGYVVSVEENGARACKPKTNRNVLTGDNCNTFVISSELKKEFAKKNPSLRNALTGHSCDFYDINIETKDKPKRCLKKQNPLSGENLASFVVSSEERPRSAKPYVYTNTLTGENRPNYKILPFEKQIGMTKPLEVSNALTGDNIKSYVFSPNEKAKSTNRRDISSPLTGTGSRGATYDISTELRQSKFTAQKLNPNSHKKTISQRNIITGENCESFLVCREMKNERRPQTADLGCRSPINNRPITCGYNILTGDTY